MNKPLDYQQILDHLYKDIQGIEDHGKVASYIPELSKVSPNKFGVSLTTLSGQIYGAGDYQERFSIQSISKLYSLSLAYNICGEDLWSRVDVEPSGTSFNSLLQLEAENGIPRNPFLNSGALVICDVLLSKLDNPKQEMLDLLNQGVGSSDITFDTAVANSEKSVGWRNIALCNYIKSYGNIDNHPDDVLDLYFHLCAISMSCRELAQASLYLANNGIIPETQQRVNTISQTKRLNAIMQTCGFYDESGEFSFRVGLPGKSGVGGGIIAVFPTQYAIAVWSPRLNEKGNSFKGMNLLEQLTTITEASIF